MFKKILITLYIIMIAAALYFAYTIFASRNTTTEHIPADPIKRHLEKDEKQTSPNHIEAQEQEKSQEKEDENTKNSEEDVQKTQEISAAYIITRTDCDKMCTHYTGDKKEYCINFCGLATATENTTCAHMTGLQKDYCTRDTAVQDGDITKCDDIGDSGIRTQCKNRINEDFIDEIM
ncbi:MAG: hypothetical protein CR972_00125 [Candidatus Moraniibacteriota bacterium]|nr:MAG: hypothetical protein CR972_00125 [Candidatus Moranbacteria bacterium]